MRPAQPEDADWLGPRLRARDCQELSATHGEPVAALREAIACSSICDVATLKGRPIFIIGCAPTERPGLGCPWLVATDEVTAYPGALTKITKHYIGVFLERWPALLNFVDERNVVSIRWLRRLGFRVLEPVAFGQQGEPFHPFTMGA